MNEFSTRIPSAGAAMSQTVIMQVRFPVQTQTDSNDENNTERAATFINELIKSNLDDSFTRLGDWMPSWKLSGGRSTFVRFCDDENESSPQANSPGLLNQNPDKKTKQIRSNDHVLQRNNTSSKKSQQFPSESRGGLRKIPNRAIPQDSMNISTSEPDRIEFCGYVQSNITTVIVGDTNRLVTQSGCEYGTYLIAAALRRYVDKRKSILDLIDVAYVSPALNTLYLEWDIRRFYNTSVSVTKRNKTLPIEQHKQNFYSFLRRYFFDYQNQSEVKVDDIMITDYYDRVASDYRSITGPQPINTTVKTIIFGSDTSKDDEFFETALTTSLNVNTDELLLRMQKAGGSNDAYFSEVSSITFSATKHAPLFEIPVETAAPFSNLDSYNVGDVPSVVVVVTKREFSYIQLWVTIIGMILALIVSTSIYIATAKYDEINDTNADRHVKCAVDCNTDHDTAQTPSELSLSDE